MQTNARSRLAALTALVFTIASVSVGCDASDASTENHDPAVLDAGPIPVGDAVLATTDARPSSDALPGDALAPIGEAGFGDALAAGADALRGDADAMRTGADALRPDVGVPQPVTAPRRECGVVLTYDGPGSVVQVAGDFTGWGERPLAMTPAQAGHFSLRLGPGDGLVPGEVHAYKLIVDGQWRLDPAQTRQKFDGDCVNSAFRLPDCEARPDLSLAETLRVTPAGDLEARVRLQAATGGTDQAFARFRLDGVPLAAPAIDGVYTVVASGLAPGKHTLSATAQDLDGREAVPLDLPFWVEATPFAWKDATLYMVMLDRFANGDRTNDAPVEGPPYPQNWHGGDLAGLQAAIESDYFEQLGVNALWLSPVNEQTDGAYAGRDDAARMFTAYHGYWPVRGREVEPRFGGNDALRAVVRAAHARGIRVLLDLINNQVHEQHEYAQAHPDWFRTGCVCGNAGCGWSERPLDCLFAPYLPDINWRVPDAERQFIADAVSWVADYGVDGFRVDAVKHVETTAIYNLRAALDERFAGPGTARLAMLGETAVGEGDRFDDGCGERYGDGYQWIAAYAGPNGLDGQFDFPTHHRMQWGLLTNSMGFDALESIVRDLETRYAPATHVRFLGSHDSNRAATRAAQDPAGDCRYTGGAPCDRLPGVARDAEVYRRLKRAFAVLYALPGVPLLYQGDELAQPGGNDPDNRRDMLFEAALGPVSMSVVAPTAEQVEFSRFMQGLGQARRTLPALRGGVRNALIAEPDLWVVDFTAPNGERALVAVNRGAGVVDRALPGAGAVADRLVFGDGSVRVEGGAALLSVPAGGVAFFGVR